MTEAIARPLAELPLAALPAAALPAAALPAAALPAAAAALVIDSPAAYQHAAELDRVCGERIAAVKSKLDDKREAAHALWKSLVATIQEFCGPAQEARELIRAKMGAYDREQERLQKEALAAEADERRRKDEEAAAKLKAALEAETQGKPEEAAELLESAAAVEAAPAPVTVIPPRPSAPGVAMRSYWSAEVVDFPALVEWVATQPRGSRARTLLLPNFPELNAEVRAQQRADLGIPGVRGVERRAPARTGR
jgi:hypothetical protein